MILQILLRHRGKILFTIAVLGLSVAAARYVQRTRSPDVALNQSRRSNEPDREITADHQFKRIRHKNVDGRSPLELVQTRGGLVTIERTFNRAGTLLREEAFLDGKPVAVPK